MISQEHLMSLNVVIVGAGIAGLAAGIALAKAGHKVTILERSSFKNEIGAAITITPNGARILDRWGFDFEAAGIIEGQHIEIANAGTLETLYNDSFAWVKPRFGYGVGFYHRVDLHKQLQKLAEASGVKIELGNHVKDVGTDGTVVVKDKGSMVADLIIVADGVHSRHIKTITDKDEPLLFSGHSSLRTLLPLEKIRSNPRLAPYFGQQTPGMYLAAGALPKPARIVTYPCRDNEVLNIAVVHDTLPGYEGRDNWHSPISLEDSQKTIEGFHPACHELLSLSDSITVYAMSRRELLPKFVNNRVVVVGDAAHVMPPTHAQGATAALEEACALQIFFTNVHHPDQISQRLDLYEQLVKPRMQITQLLSEATPGQNDHFRQQAEVLCEQCGFGKPYPDNAPYISEPVGEFFYGFDMKAEAEHRMKSVSK